MRLFGSKKHALRKQSDTKRQPPFPSVPGLIWQLTQRCHERDFRLYIDLNIARVGAARRPGVRALQWQFDRRAIALLAHLPLSKTRAAVTFVAL